MVSFLLFHQSFGDIEVSWSLELMLRFSSQRVNVCLLFFAEPEVVDLAVVLLGFVVYILLLADSRRSSWRATILRMKTTRPKSGRRSPRRPPRAAAGQRRCHHRLVTGGKDTRLPTASGKATSAATEATRRGDGRAAKRAEARVAGERSIIDPETET